MQAYHCFIPHSITL